MTAPAATIDPEKIRKELADLWINLAKEPEQASGSGVLRACSMTLIAAVDEGDNLGEIGETLASLMREHPSRAIVLRLSNEQGPSLSSRVFAQCWMPFGHRRQICCEQIEITASAVSLPDVPAVILPLTVADLPVMIWCKSARLFQLPAFAALAAISQKVMVDSRDFGKPKDALLFLQRFAKTYHVADLAWTRTTRWRELLAQIFENRNYLAALPQVTRITIKHPEPVPPPSFLYIGVWVQQCIRKLTADPPKVEWIGGEASTVKLSAGEAFHARIRLLNETDVEITVQGQTSRAVFPPVDYATLLREELSIPEHDPVFNDVLNTSGENVRNIDSTAE